ncbi:MAG: hypothetical protein K8963_10720, partial [Proteobacteria bacterium]|nr:hypothetical protein [Pseudomonadota bacterium]
AFNWNFGGQHAYINSATGTVRATNNATLTFGTGALTNNGGLFEADAGSAIVYTGNTKLFNDGTRFVGEHRITGNSTFVGQIDSDNLRFIGGAQLSGDGTAGSKTVLPGIVHWEGGDLAGAWEIKAGAVVDGTGATAKRQVGSDITNNGTFRWSTTQQLQGGNGSVFTNNGLTEVTESAAFNWIFGGQHAYINSATGTVHVTNNATLTFGTGALTNNGGLLEADAGSAIVYTGNTKRFNDGTRFVGEHRISGNSRFVDTIHSDDLRFISGTQTGGDGSLGSFGRMTGGVTWESGDLQGRFEIKAGAVLNATTAAAKRQVGSELLNNGTIVWSTEQQLQGGNSSVLTNNGRFEMTTDADLNWIFGGQAQLVN